MEFVMEELKLLLAALIAALIVSCQTDNIPAGGFNQMYGGNILCEFRIDVISICALKDVRV